MFNGIEVSAYGEMYPFNDLAQTSIQGSNMLIVKVFDDDCKEEVLKSLQRSDFDMSVETRGTDIMVKLGANRKELISAGLKKVKLGL